MSLKLKVQLDECRISYLFKTENPIDEEKLEFRLIDKKYKINKDRIITRPPLQAVILNFARKGGIDIIYEKSNIPTFIGVMGKNHNNVVTEFEHIKHILEDIDEFILEESTGLETVLSCKVFGDPKPNLLLPLFAKDHIKKFDNKFGKNFVMDNFTLKHKNSKTLISIHIAPLYRDIRYFYIQLVLKDDSLEHVFDFVENHETYITDVMEIMSSNG